MPLSGKIMTTTDAFRFLESLEAGSVDLIISSPPYFMGKEYDTSMNKEDFCKIHDALAPLLTKVLKPGGSLCWQVGHHVVQGTTFPLDIPVYTAFSAQKELTLRNRIIWTFGHGMHARRRFSGRYETILWFTRGSDYYFNLDAVRVPQKYPGKKHYKGPRKGEWSGNPGGKNPTDVWEIPNVKANHIEKTDHPCQFPVALAQRLVRALCPPGGLVIDCFAGVATVGVAALIEGRKFRGCDLNPTYVAIGKERLDACAEGKLSYRPIDRPILVPSMGAAVARPPSHFKASSD